jgi:hypothetical protein
MVYFPSLDICPQASERDNGRKQQGAARQEQKRKGTLSDALTTLNMRISQSTLFKTTLFKKVVVARNNLGEMFWLGYSSIGLCDHIATRSGPPVLSR